MTTVELSGCVIVSGMLGAGKSTVTGLAARPLPRAGGPTRILVLGDTYDPYGEHDHNARP